MSLSLAQGTAVAEEGVEVLTRGPIHEAFVETVAFKPTEGILAPKAPPALIEELPPEQRPEGDRVQWIPGYWSWDDESNEFIWVSGIWRNTPPGRQWIPGAWQESGSEFQWVSGYWANTEAEDVEYLPEPPASLEVGANVKRPSASSVWIPGNWAYRENRYLWSSGYWDEPRQDWVYMPSYYNWTPSGYIYVDGYWDYDVPRRGLCFAPVRFAPSYYGRPGYRYNPVITIALDLLSDSLFVRPRHRHYYFGDYYASDYRDRGFYSYNTYYSDRHGYDPIWAHQRWTHRNDDRWERRVSDNFAFFRDNRDQRPPHTYAAFQDFGRNNPDVKRRFATNFAAPIATIATRQDRPFKLQAVNADERQRFVTNGRETRDFGDRWRKAAPQPVVATTPGTTPGGKPNGPAGRPLNVEPKRVKMPVSPMVAKLPEKAGAADTPPPSRPAPKLTDNPKLRPGGRNGRNPGAAVEPGETPKVTPGTPGETPKVTPVPGVDPKGNPKLNPKGRPGREPSVDPTPKVTPQPGETPKVTPAPGEDPKRNPKMTPKGRPGREPSVDPTPKVTPQPGDTPKVTPTPGTEPGRNPKGRPGRQPSADPTPATPKVTPNVEPKISPKVIPPREPKSRPRVEPTPAPTPKAEPRIAPQPSAPKPERRVEPRPTPQPTPRVAPQPRPTPQPQPRVAPQPQPQPQPRVAPQPSSPRPAPSSDDKDKDKKRGR